MLHNIGSLLFKIQLFFCFFILMSCSHNDNNESSSFTQPIELEEKVIVIYDNTSSNTNGRVFAGKLAQGYVKGGLVVADIIRTDSLTGNLQQDAGEVTAVSDSDGGYALSASYQNFVLFSSGGTVTNADGEEVSALPMLAPMPEVGQTTVNVTPLTTLVTTQPALKATLDELGGWNTDIADPAGVSGQLLRVAKTVETVLQVLTSGDNPLLESTAAQLEGVAAVAATLVEQENLTSDEALQTVTTAAVTNILDNPNLVAPSKIAESGVREQILNSVSAAVAAVSAAIPDASDTVVEAEVIADIEDAVDNATAQVDEAVGNSLTIGLAFSPVIEEIQLTRSAASTLTLQAAVSDDGPQSALRFQWSMEGHTFSGPTTNPTEMTDYHDNVTGALTLRVTDENGSGRTTILTRALSVGEFPWITTP